MSDSLKDRLASHSGAFEGLLSLIPAKYYYEDDTKAQLSEPSANGTAATAKASRSKRPKKNVDAGSSALDEMKRRESHGIESSSDNDNEENDVTIYDDQGNQISGPKELSIQELLQSKARGEAVPVEEQPSSSEQAQRPTASNGSEAKPEAGSRGKPGTRLGPEPSSKKEAAKSEDLRQEPSAVVTEATGTVNAPEQAGAPAESETKDSFPENKKGISELRAKLAARISEMRAKRKAPGSNAPGAPKNREELLSLRKQRQEQKQKTQELKRKRGGDSSDDEANGDQLDDAVDAKLDESLMFGQVEFNDGGRLSRNLDHIDEKKRVKKRNAKDQLSVLESRKAKIEQLSSDKKNQVTENAKWSRAILQSEGAKVRDDEKMLRKTLRNKERQKSKSAKEWRERKETVANDIAKREAKRTANIKAHREAKQLRLKGKKRREHMKRAGFEGRQR